VDACDCCATHVLLWVPHDRLKLSTKARRLLVDPLHECWVSAASAWEIAIRASIGKLKCGR